MPRYLTPQQYRMVDDGVLAPPNSAMPGLLTVPDATLARYIARAEASIDAFIGAPLLTNNGFAPGIINIYQQGFDFTTRKMRIPLPVVPIRKITRVRVHISNSGPQNAGLYADLLPEEVVIQQWEGYAEIIALTLTYSMASVVWELGLNPPILEVDMEAGFYLPYIGDTLYDTGDHTTYRALRGFWALSYDQAPDIQPNVLPPTTPAVYVNGVLQASTTYTLNAIEGSVTFNAQQSAAAVVTADYTATIPDVVMTACLDQVTWLLQQRVLTQMGMGGIDQMRNGDLFARRPMKPDPMEDQLCGAARLKLAPYRPVAVG